MQPFSGTGEGEGNNRRLEAMGRKAGALGFVWVPSRGRGWKSQQECSPSVAREWLHQEGVRAGRESTHKVDCVWTLAGDGAEGSRVVFSAEAGNRMLSL